jgi:hypothetical protein
MGKKFIHWGLNPLSAGLPGLHELICVDTLMLHMAP